MTTEAISFFAGLFAGIALTLVVAAVFVKPPVAERRDDVEDVKQMFDGKESIDKKA
ncbi:hypothetical protein [Cohnella sp. GbtcB17]|uniref:hypothetical protein n=1 Tax=Cohnella sp. GbtcB17 TaxID=2824762 RepID=UPI001C2F3E1F|nr:hypothetical protein [Cohnella sp. GbtcB17]